MSGMRLNPLLYMYDRAVPKAADLSFSLIESHGSIQSTVSEAPQVHVVFKDVQHHRELGEHQCLKVRRDKLGSDSWAYIMLHSPFTTELHHSKTENFHSTIHIH